MGNDFDMRTGCINNQSMGVYNCDNQLNLDAKVLKSLGFKQGDIDTLNRIVSSGGKVTPKALTGYGLSYEDAGKLKYMYDIATGKVVIESTQDLSKHLKKLFGKHRRIGIQDLILSKVHKVPRKAVIGGIKDKTYALYNSKNYKDAERFYNVESVTGKRIVVSTNRKPVLKRGESKKLDGILEIKELRANKDVVVSFDKQYARLCNRFIIVGSLRRPEIHHGLVEIICVEGTKVYVYVTTMKTGEIPSFKGGSQRIYDYGFMPNEIYTKLIKTASALYKKLCGVFATTEKPNADYKILNEVKTVEEEYSEDDNDVVEY